MGEVGGLGSVPLVLIDCGLVAGLLLDWEEGISFRCPSVLCDILLLLAYLICFWNTLDSFSYLRRSPP